MNNDSYIPCYITVSQRNFPASPCRFTNNSEPIFLLGKINFLMSCMQGYINIQQNQIIKIFSIAAVILLPSKVVSNIYGVNYQHMCEIYLLLGYHRAIVLIIVSDIAGYWFFKGRRSRITRGIISTKPLKILMF